MKTLLKISVFCVLVAVALGGAYAQFAKPEDAIRYRKSVMFLIAQHFGRMGAMVNEKMPYNKEVFARNALLVRTLASLPWEAAMVPGSDKGDTTLKSSIFAQQTEFNAVAKAFETETSKLVGTAQSDDFNAIKAQFGEVAKSCKACHSQFRTK